jgi:hypothetical protein
MSTFALSAALREKHYATRNRNEWLFKDPENNG